MAKKHYIPHSHLRFVTQAAKRVKDETIPANADYDSEGAHLFARQEYGTRTIIPCDTKTLHKKGNSKGGKNLKPTLVLVMLALED